MKKILLDLLAGTLETIAESKLVEVLQKLHDTNPVQYKAAIYGGLSLVAALKPLTDGTATKIDDAVINSLEDALKQSAAINGIDTDLAQTQDEGGEDGTNPPEGHGNDKP